MQPIQVEFTFTPESFGKAQVYIMIRLLKRGWTKWIVLLLAAGWVAKSIYKDGISGLATGLLPIAVFAGLWWVLFRWLSRRNFSKFPNLQHTISYVFSEENIHLVTHTTDGILQWETFQQAEEAKEFFLLYQNAFAASPILKSAFQNETALERFREMLRFKHLLKQ